MISIKKKVTTATETEENIVYKVIAILLRLCLDVNIEPKMTASVNDFLHARSLWHTVQSWCIDGWRGEGVSKIKCRLERKAITECTCGFKGESWDANTRINQPCCVRAAQTPSECSSPTPTPSSAKSAVLSDLCSWAHCMSCHISQNSTRVRRGRLN